MGERLDAVLHAAAAVLHVGLTAGWDKLRDAVIIGILMKMKVMHGLLQCGWILG